MKVMTKPEAEAFHRRQLVERQPCPRDYCRARPGQPCTRKGGRPHLDRVIDATHAQQAAG